MILSLEQYEELCSKLKPNKIYTTRYGRRFVSSTYKRLIPPVSFNSLPNLSNFLFEIRPIVIAAVYLNFSHFIYFGHSYPFDG